MRYVDDILSSSALLGVCGNPISHRLYSARSLGFLRLQALKTMYFQLESRLNCRTELAIQNRFW